MSNEIDDAKEFADLVQTLDLLEKHYGKPVRDNEVRVIPTSPSDEKVVLNPGQPSQWSLYGPGFAPTTPTVPTLPSGIFDICADNKTVFAVPTLPPTGILLELPEMRSEEVIKQVERFWDSEKDYKEGNDFVVGGAAYKAGIMLYGPPGSGKSCTIKLVSKKLIERNGTVFYGGTSPNTVMAFLQDFSKIEPNRKCIVILEDIDSLIGYYGEAGYLEMMDSAKTIDNVLFIATTNYPERLDPRIYNRPGRLSHTIKIGLPSAATRTAYLKAILKNHRDVEEIVSLSDGFTIDHLTALINAVYREKKDLHKEIERLRILFKVPKAGEQRKIGIGE